jgi:hypothetical protein
MKAVWAGADERELTVLAANQQLSCNDTETPTCSPVERISTRGRPPRHGRIGRRVLVSALLSSIPHLTTFVFNNIPGSIG